MCGTTLYPGMIIFTKWPLLPTAEELHAVNDKLECDNNLLLRQMNNDWFLDCLINWNCKTDNGYRLTASSMGHICNEGIFARLIETKYVHCNA